jgi:hypothetical protein
MAKAYVAVSKIDGGRVNGDGNVEKYLFEPGEVVKGLTKDEMKNLWDAGAIREVDVVEVEKAEEASSDEGRVEEPTG